MKKIILTAAILIISSTAFAQDGYLAGLITNKPSLKNFGFGIHGRYERPVYKEDFYNAQLISDVVDGYPVNWIDEYISVTLLATCNGKKVQASSTNDKLTAAQKNILKMVDLGSDMVINVQYNYIDPLSKNKDGKELHIEMQVINIKMTVTPENEATYASGANEMRAYLKANAISKIPDATILKIKTAQVIFTINEAGEIQNVKLTQTSNDAATDKLLVDVITKMPKWKPAKNDKGIKVKQEFEFNVGQLGC